MSHHSRALALLLVTLALTAACTRTARDQRVGQDAPPPAPTAPAPAAAQVPSGVPAPTAALAPIPDHPPVTTTGVVASFDPATGVVIFRDGRIMKLTEQSRVLRPVETRTVRPGEPVIVRNALSVGVLSATPGREPARLSTPPRGHRQRMATGASVDQPKQLVRLTDGSAVRVTPPSCAGRVRRRGFARRRRVPRAGRRGVRSTS